MVGRDNKGRFKKGEYSGGPGRPKKELEKEYQEIFTSTCTPVRFRAICEKVVSKAQRGDHAAIKLVFDYLIGPPVQKQEHTGADGGPVIIQVVRENRDRVSSQIAYIAPNTGSDQSQPSQAQNSKGGSAGGKNDIGR